jgi:hypothetical protein
VCQCVGLWPLSGARSARTVGSCAEERKNHKALNTEEPGEWIDVPNRAFGMRAR